ncbi:MAG: ribosome maturation factor RimM [Candidatus Latescibacteria bacterium]|nr:ribosome maturation factor RimM [Candidatus Latescibacterota bacterium]
MNAEWVNIGFIRKPHGLQGYIRVQSLSDAPNRFTDLNQINIEFQDGHRETLDIETCRPDRDTLLMKFKGIDTPEEVTRLRGVYIQVPLTQAAPLPAGAFYVFEMIGSKVVSEEEKTIGVVREVISMPANDIIVVDTPDGELLVPAIQDVVLKISPEEERIVIRLIPGLIA